MVRGCKRYDEYKDSGIEWIGEIPEEWKYSKLKYFLENNESGVWGDDPKEDEEKYEVLRSTEITINGSWDINSPAKRYIQKGDREKYLIKNNNLLVVKSSGSLSHLGKTVIANESIEKKEYLFSNFLQRLSLLNYYPKYLYYMFNNNIIKTQFRYLSTTTTGLNNLSAKIFNDLIIPIPSISEQQKIASFLDTKTAKIDKIIMKKEKLIDQLEKYKKSVITEAVIKGKLGDKYINEDGELVDEIEMKDSEVEWIGEIHSYWDISKVKYIADIHGRIGYRGYTKDDLVDKGNGALTLGGKHIDDNNKIDLSDPTYISWEKYYESPEIMVKYNDLLVVQRGSIGKVAMIDKEISEATINPSLILINNIEIEPKYFYYYLNSFSVSEFFKLIVSSTAVPMISQEQFDNLHLPKMNLDIQQKIVSYLKQKTQQIDNLIQKTKQSTEKYKKYKRSLIFEAVTGKIDLRDCELEGGEEFVEHNNSRETKRECLSAVD